MDEGASLPGSEVLVFWYQQALIGLAITSVIVVMGVVFWTTS
jgi:hypothetical protein